MSYCLSPSPCSFFINRYPLDLRRSLISSPVSSSDQFTSFNFSKLRKACLAASISGRKLEVSWLAPDGNATDDYGGWSVLETRIEDKKKKKNGFTRFFVVVAGASVAILLAAAYLFFLSSKGFTFRYKISLNAFQRMRTESKSLHSQSGVASLKDSEFDSVLSEGIEHRVPDTTSETNISVGKFNRLIVPVAADSTQLEALQILKKLKIIEADVKADELCTRREYARWLVKANSSLERSAKHRIMPSMLPSCCVILAFDDITFKDPDFWSIQALAEAGIVLSKPINKKSCDLDSPKGRGRIDFSPGSFISRLDLINWKAQLEYPWRSGIEQEISRKKFDFIDVRAIGPDASSELFMDMLAGDRSMLRKVFGQSRRFQPDKPATKAQAAVALTSGRMTEAIHTELSRLEAENSSRLAEIEEIKSEFLLREDILRFWDVKRQELKALEVEMASHLDVAIHDLKQEKNIREKSIAEYLKEKSTLDCQRQLLSNLKEEVNEMSKRLASERDNLVAEQQSLQDASIELHAKQESMIEAKSILEAEKEALHILRSWVEDEARRNQARAKVLEEVGRRWKWDDMA